MAGKKNPKDLAKLLAYALGRRPDEFGLVPDTEGFVRIKTLLQALGEEAGWKYVRESHLREVVLSVSDPPVEMVESRIRARDGSRLPEPAYEPSPPGLLYHCVRRRAWPHVRQKGLKPVAEARVCLAADPEAALRRGRRIDPDPVLVTVHTTNALDLEGLLEFYRNSDAAAENQRRAGHGKAGGDRKNPGQLPSGFDRGAWGPLFCRKRKTPEKGPRLEAGAAPKSKAVMDRSLEPKKTCEADKKDLTKRERGC